MSVPQSAEILKIPPLADLDDPTFDPFLGDELTSGDTLDPYAVMHKMAAESWVHHVEYRKIFMDTPNQTLEPFDLDYYTVFGYDRCAEALPRAEEFSNEALKMLLGNAFGNTISGMDAPDHPRYRLIFQKAFLPHTVKKWGETLVKPIVENMLRKVVHQGRCDLVKDLTFEYPFEVIYRQLNLPPEDIKTFHKLAIAQSTFVYAPDKGAEAGQKLGVYFSNLIAARREQPGDDLVSALALAEVDGEHLPDDVLVAFLRQLTNAGGDTTYRGTSLILAALLTHPEQLEAVRQDRSLIPAAIEEGLRWENPVMTIGRLTTREVTLHGYTFPKRAYIDFVLGSANRDKAKFPDSDKFDIFRPKGPRQLAFASGPHVCIGQHLARVEMEQALNVIFDMLPNVRLDPDMPPPEIRGLAKRVPAHLHVKFSPA